MNSIFIGIIFTSSSAKGVIFSPLFVCHPHNTKSYGPILQKFSGTVGSGPKRTMINFWWWSGSIINQLSIIINNCCLGRGLHSQSAFLVLLFSFIIFSQTLAFVTLNSHPPETLTFLFFHISSCIVFYVFKHYVILFYALSSFFKYWDFHNVNLNSHGPETVILLKGWIETIFWVFRKTVRLLSLYWLVSIFFFLLEDHQSGGWINIDTLEYCQKISQGLLLLLTMLPVVHD